MGWFNLAQENEQTQSRSFTSKKCEFFSCLTYGISHRIWNCFLATTSNQKSLRPIFGFWKDHYKTLQRQFPSLQNLDDMVHSFGDTRLQREYLNCLVHLHWMCKSFVHRMFTGTFLSYDPTLEDFSKTHKFLSDNDIKKKKFHEALKSIPALSVITLQEPHSFAVLFLIAVFRAYCCPWCDHFMSKFGNLGSHLTNCEFSNFA